MNEKEVCGLCKFFHRMDADKGECRRQPPSAVIMPMPIATDEKSGTATILRAMPNGRGRAPMVHQPAPPPQSQRVGPVGYWPPTNNTLWCGEFKPEGA